MGNQVSKRLRIFAGPNGSGKTTIINALKNKVKLGVYINADDIENSFSTKGFIDLFAYKIKSDTKEIQDFIRQNSISIYKDTASKIDTYLRVEGDKLYLKETEVNSYIAADVAEFLRRKLIEAGISFSFETVLSHPSKLDLIRRAKQQGFRVYLYYVATESEEINIERVKNRVAKKGHNVAPEIIRKRYKRSLDLLYETIKISDRAFVFDNSGIYYELVAEITEGKSVQIINEVPNWFVEYFYNKSLK